MKLEARFQKQLRSFSLEIAIQIESPTLVLWGASGAGKTQTLNCLAGFSRPDAGRIVIGDRLFFDATTNVHVSPQKRRCGYLFQDHALFPHMTVLENLKFAAQVSSKTPPSRVRFKTRINEMLEAFELGDLAKRKPAQLSGGQQQRAALARALLGQPECLLLDEPTQGLDERLKRSFFELLRKIRKQSQPLIVLVTHNLDECFELGDYICLLANGKVLQSGPRDSVFLRPASVEVARSLGIYNIVPAEIEFLDPGRNLSRLRIFDHSWTGPYFPAHLIGDRGFAAFRETAVLLSQQKQALSLVVTSVKQFSQGVRLEFENDIAAIVSEAEARRVEVGAAVPVEVNPSELVFLNR